MMNFFKARPDTFLEPILLRERRICHSAEQLSSARFLSSSSSSLPSFPSPAGKIQQSA